MMQLIDLSDEILINILNYIGFYNDYKNLKNTNKYFNKLLYNLTDGIYYVDVLNINIYIIYNEYNKFYKYKFFKQLIIIDNIYDIFKFKLNNIKLLDINLFSNENYIFNELILNKMYNLKYLNISESNIHFLPTSLTKLEYLNISDTKIKYIPIEYVKLKYLINVSYHQNYLQFIPKSICNNIEYLELINNCIAPLYLSNNIKFIESYEGDKYIQQYNKSKISSIYINNTKIKPNDNNMIIYYKKNKKYDNYNIPKLYYYCLI